MPRKKPADPFSRVRQICLTLPEAVEVEAWGEPTFRVRRKIFTMLASAENHHGAGRVAAWIKCDRETQAFLIRSDPDRFFSPPYVGPSGWIGVRLEDGVDWGHVEELVRDGYCAIAPKKLGALVRAGAS